jgi:hypothetical protein
MSYEKYASSALSAASLGRVSDHVWLPLTSQNMFGAFLPLGSQALFKNLGYQWAGR